MTIPINRDRGDDPIPWKSRRVTAFLQHCFVENKLYGQASRAISTGKLNASLRLHTQPIKQVVYLCPLALAGGRSNLGACFPLICFQRLSLPNVATQRCPWRDNWYTRGSSVQVLSYYGPAPLKSPAPAVDRDRTVSRRSKPSSRTALTGEQPDPWDPLQPQDAMSRHRGAKQSRRYELLETISLLSPAYLLSVERWPFHAGPPDH